MSAIFAAPVAAWTDNDSNETLRSPSAAAWTDNDSNKTLESPPPYEHDLFKLMPGLVSKLDVAVDSAVLAGEYALLLRSVSGTTYL